MISLYIMDKIVRDLNAKAWDRFIGYCRMHRVKLGTKLSESLDAFLKKNLNNPHAPHTQIHYKL